MATAKDKTYTYLILVWLAKAPDNMIGLRATIQSKVCKTKNMSRMETAITMSGSVRAQMTTMDAGNDVINAERATVRLRPSPYSLPITRKTRNRAMREKTIEIMESASQYVANRRTEKNMRRAWRTTSIISHTFCVACGRRRAQNALLLQGISAV